MQLKSMGLAGTLVAVVVAAAAVGIGATHGRAFLWAMENRTADLRVVHLSPKEPLSEDVIVVGVNEDTLAGFPYRSPLNRHFLSGLLRKLDGAGVKALGLDILFDQPTEPEADKELMVVLAGLKAPVTVAWAGAEASLTERQIAYLKTLPANVKQGDVTLKRDLDDNTVRWIKRGTVLDGRTIHGFPYSIAGKDPGDLSAPPVRLRYRMGPDNETKPFKVFPAHMVKVLPAVWFKDKVVLVGAILPHDDIHRTPFAAEDEADGTIPGVLIHAHAVAQLLDGSKAVETTLTEEVIYAVVIALLAAGLFMVEIPLIVKGVVAVLVLVGWWFAGAMAYKYLDVMVPLVSTSLAFLISAMGSTSLFLHHSRKQGRYIKKAFAQYVSPVVADQMVADPSKFSLDGERREITCIFTDLAGFTTLIESSEPSVVVPLLNEYLGGMCQIVFDYEGTMDKIVGDALHCMFNAPLDQPDHAPRAVACALELDRFANDFVAKQAAQGFAFGGTRIGVHSGPATVGNFGGDAFFDYTAHGDTVNSSARLESVNKHTGTRICVSGAAAGKSPDVRFRPIGCLVLKGKSEGIDTFEPILHDMTQDNLDAYQAAYDLMHREDPGANDAFRRLVLDFPNDTLAAMHARRLAGGENGSTIILKEK
jgi:adenylate cyclase